jgi:hypothetical protein
MSNEIWVACFSDFTDNMKVSKEGIEGVKHLMGKWTYGGDAEFFFYAETEDLAKDALMLRLQEKIREHALTIDELST